MRQSALEPRLRPFGLTLRLLPLLAPLLTAACVGVIGDPSPGAGPGEDPASKKPAPSPLSRLTSPQYDNTLRDLFAPIAVPSVTLPASVAVEGFSNNAATQTPSAALIEALSANAIAVATEAMKSKDTLLGCAPTTRAEEDQCAGDFVQRFARRAFRRPVEPAEVEDLIKLYTDLRLDPTTDFAAAMTLVLEVVLQSPELVYRIETGDPSPTAADVVTLRPYEIASRLSYLLWSTMPDEALFAAAASGALATPEGIEKEARRMLADPRARAAVLGFHRAWLRFSKMDDLAKDQTLFPGFTADTAEALRDSADRTVDWAFFEDGKLDALLTDARAFVNDELAPIYGVAPPGTSELTLVSVDPKQRSGILTHAGLMAGFAHQTADSPVLRGVWVLDRFLCSEPPPPPKGVNATLPAPTTSAPTTTRDRFATQHEQGACASCHHIIDGIGFGFESYDAIGAYRTQENGLPIDASGWFSPGQGDLTGAFEGAVELGKKLVQSTTVHTCVASSWMRHALGVDHKGISEAGLRPVVEAFEASGLDMRELVVALTKSDAFRTRPIKP